MKNQDLVADYIRRAQNRLAAVAVLMERDSYADVVRESQELIELCLKALLSHSHIEVPRTHDVSDILIDSKERLPKSIQINVGQLAKISHRLRRDRELSFYGSEDLTPSDFYTKDDASQAFDDAKWVVSVCEELIK